ncbi:hypothetical protein Vretimale_6016 [Volvox reticuliferus]|uniref:Uncharacterized protein n=1 Tax=Volvox reticuliferus TaxID=1737510 RepID=A0A8J4C7Y6_9CHLO|nr:hypothetical protein Vretifemale_6166 [Volvox reticuliferus]GIM01188.1 hypothetical protein Vretimale_6016 [Volvox reticuliferus]
MESTRYRIWSHGKRHESRVFRLSSDPWRAWTLHITHLPVNSHQGSTAERSCRSDRAYPAQATPVSGLPPLPPVQRVGTCVQVPHQTFLDMGSTSDRFWTLVTQTLVPAPERRDMTVLLACLESVYRAEYQQCAGEAITAIAAANNAHVRPDGTLAEPPADTDSGLATAAAQLNQRDGKSTILQPQPEKQRKGNGDVEDPSPAVAAAAAALAKLYSVRIGTGNAVTDSAGAALEEMGTGGVRGRPAGGEGDGNAAAIAADLDDKAMRQLLRLAQRAGYQRLTMRDVRLADSLNTDYLSQLFIKGSTRRLDGALVQDYVDSSLPAEARPVLLLQRGYGRELQAGRLLLQKLDYLQTLAVGQAGSWAGGAAAVLAAVLFGTFEESGPGAASMFVDTITGTEATANRRVEEATAGRNVDIPEVTLISAAAATGAAVGPEENGAVASKRYDKGGKLQAVGAAAIVTESWVDWDNDGDAEDNESQILRIEDSEEGPSDGHMPEAAAAAAAADSAVETQGVAVLAVGAAAAAAAGAAGFALKAQQLGAEVIPERSRQVHNPRHQSEQSEQQQQQEQRAQGRDPLDLEEEEQAEPHREDPEKRQSSFPWPQRERGVELHRRADGRPVIGAVSAQAPDPQPAKENAWEAGRSSSWPQVLRGRGRAGCFRGETVASSVLGGPAAAATTTTSAAGRSVMELEATGELAAPGEAAGNECTTAAMGAVSPVTWASTAVPSVSVKENNGASSLTADTTSAGGSSTSVDADVGIASIRRSSRVIGSSSTSSGRSGFSALGSEGNDQGEVDCSDQDRRLPVVAETSAERATVAGSVPGVAGVELGTAAETKPSTRAAPDPSPETSGDSTAATADPTTAAAPPQPRPLETALSTVYSALSDWGLVPRTDVIPLTTFNSHFPVRERPGRQPLFICKVSLGDALGGTDWLRSGLRGLLDGLLREVQLQEPTFREVMVLYRPAHSRMAPTRDPPLQPKLGLWPRRRRQSSDQQLEGDRNFNDEEDEATGREAGSGRGRRERHLRVTRGLQSGWLLRLWKGWRGVDEEEPAVRRPPIQIRIYRDIPLPTWKAVLPEKLLQFRPLDLLRVDLFALAGLAGLAAQARYDSMLVDIITFGSAAVLLVRIVLGYQRMSDRFRSVVNELLAEKALAGQEGAVEAMAMAAAQQQLRQAALAYVLLLHHCRPGGQDLQQQQQQAASAGAPGESMAATGPDLETIDAPAMATTAQLQGLAEWALAHYSGVRVRFNACQALHELHRLGLVVRVAQHESDSGTSSNDDGCDVGVGEDIPNGVGPRGTSGAGMGSPGLKGAGVKDSGDWSVSECTLAASSHEASEDGCSCGDLAVNCDGKDSCRSADMWWAAVPLRDAVPVVEDHWAGLLWRRVDAILSRRDCL